MLAMESHRRPRRPARPPVPFRTLLLGLLVFTAGVVGIRALADPARVPAPGLAADLARPPNSLPTSVPSSSLAEEDRASGHGRGRASTASPINEGFPGLTTFRGNASRSYYGEGPVPRRPAILWRYPASGALCSRSTNLVKVYGEAVVRVDHALLAVRGARLEGIRRVYSHWQALAQSEEFLASLRVEMHPVHDTAGAARMIAERDDPQEAAVASIDAGSRFGLKVLAERIQTYPDNFTKFAVIGTGDPGLGPPDKTSLVMAVHDRPGSLLASLQPFADRDVNLTKLESRPRPGAPFEYVFYVDSARAADDEAVLAALEQVRSHTSLLKVLGSYPSHPNPL